MSIQLQPPLTKQHNRRKPTTAGIAIALSVAAVSATVVAFSEENSPLMRWEHERNRIHDRDEIASVMVPLAAVGKPDAVIWYAKNYANAPLAPLQKLADAGNAQAMWLL